MAQAKNEPRKPKGTKSNAIWPKSKDPFKVTNEEEIEQPPRSTESDIKFNDRPKTPRPPTRDKLHKLPITLCKYYGSIGGPVAKNLHGLLSHLFDLFCGSQTKLDALF